MELNMQRGQPLATLRVTNPLLKSPLKSHYFLRSRQSFSVANVTSSGRKETGQDRTNTLLSQIAARDITHVLK